MNFKERSAPCLASTCPCLLTVSSHGRLTNTSVRHQLPLGDVSLFTDLMSDSSSDQNSKTEISNTEGSIDQGESKVFFNSILRSGTLLSNGSGYFLQKSGLIISTCLSATNSKLLVKQAGQRHAVHDPLVVPQIALFGSQEQESKISVCQSSLKNKQSSMFGGIKTGHSGPADLLKLFSKLRDTGYVRGKDKFEFNKSSPHTTSSASASASNARDDYDNGFDKSPRIARKSIFSVSKDKSSNVTRQTDAVQNVMADTMRSLEERGEKLSKLNNQADEISQNASTFRDLAKIHKNNMDKKANKWGGIL